MLQTRDERKKARERSAAEPGGELVSPSFRARTGSSVVEHGTSPAGNRDGEINPRRRCGDDVCRQHVSTPASILQPPRALDHQWIISRTRDVAGVISENGLSIRSCSGSFRRVLAHLQSSGTTPHLWKIDAELFEASRLPRLVRSDTRSHSLLRSLEHTVLPERREKDLLRQNESRYFRLCLALSGD